MVKQIHTQAIIDVIAERYRQNFDEGYDADHDDSYVHDELALAGATYALPARFRNKIHKAGEDEPGPSTWPWENIFFKPGDRRRELVKAAALIIAEIERMDRGTDVTA